MITWVPSALTNHLWQSTLFVLIVWLATLALRRNGARVRFWLWTASSVKFLLPLSWLVSLGEAIQWREPPAARVDRGPAGRRDGDGRRPGTPRPHDR